MTTPATETEPAAATDSTHQTATNTSTTTNTTNRTRPAAAPQRRTFSLLGRLRFRMSRARLLDTLCDGLNYCMESLVYLIGPLLIILALSIVTLLAYSFFFILLPMMDLKHAANPYKTAVLGTHVLWVVVLLVNILFNYALCVTTRHKGPHHAKLVREMAAATNSFSYPETPAQMEEYRKDFEEKLILRLRQRKAQQAKDYQQRQQQKQPSQQQALAETPAGMTQRRKNTASTKATAAAPPPLRHWMLLGPFEWGYCANSDQPKPPRSHYDHVSKQLVLNLDHYCPWMFNAIGYFNYRYFVNFLIYIFVGMLYGALLSYEPFMLLSSDDYKDQVRLERRMMHKGAFVLKPDRLKPMVPYRDEKTFVALSFMLCAAVGLAVFLLGTFHVYLTMTAQTTIEFHGNWAARKRARREGHAKWINPYAAGGWRQNWCQVYGHQYASKWNWWMSLLPSAREPDMLPAPLVMRDKKGGVKSETEEEHEGGERVSLVALNKRNEDGEASEAV